MILNAAYYAQGYGLDVNPIAIRPSFIDKDGQWEDTTDRKVHFRFSKIIGLPLSKENRLEWDQCPKQISILIQNGTDKKTITLTLMSLQVYNTNVRIQVAGQLRFNTDQEVQSFYLTHIL